ncbi:DnaJ domain containing protein [Senna tora]|uniref:DnaJ domain containing protein n=1 Tax=Senna tora TaxID=362788 RepID=A0A834WRV1_9FABA|nr:DnaJ domain containing protein [Senna tora]
MIGKGFLRKHFQPETHSGKTIPESDQVKGNCINAVLIDIDDDQVSEVIIIDEPEFFHEKSHCSSVPSRDRKFLHQSVISIDDDEDDDNNHAYHPGNIAEGGQELDSDASSNIRFSSPSGYKQNCGQINIDDVHVTKEKVSESNLPNGRHTFPTEAADGNHCGLDGSSESDCSDCELMEAREEWEKAWFKRKCRVAKDQPDEQANSSGYHSTIYTDVGGENRTWQHAGSPVYSGPSNGKCVKENPCSFSVMGDSSMNGTNCNLGTENSCEFSDHKVDQEKLKNFRSGSTEEMRSLHKDSSCTQSPESRRKEHCSFCTKYRMHGFAGGVSSDSRFENEMGGIESKYRGSNVEESKRQVDDKRAHSNDASFDERHASHDGFVSQQSHDWWHTSGLGAEEKIGPNPEDSTFCSLQSFGKSRISNCSEVEVRAESEVISVHNTLNSDLQDKQDRSWLVENEKPSNVGDALHAEDNSVTNSYERDIIDKREKLKETDEYKRTIEKEWASRQRELQIQAEEVQKLRKRKRAEAMRLLDMRRRQKERIEEMRETKKKDEENMNIKEKYRAEIMKGLSQLEMTCIDMASLLTCLGIQVGGGFNPLPHEVHKAYKRALLKFHPDRAPKSDIREQVEAEEKFKLISRMKEKLLSTF